MASSIDRRIRALEAIYGEGACPECGFDGDLSEVEVSWDDFDSLEDPQSREPVYTEFCGMCCQHNVFVVTWQYFTVKKA